jgi:hypothetical protein
MLELIDFLPGNVVGVVARGRVTREECDDILVPAMDASARRHGKVRLYYEIDCRYPGTGWDELDIGASRLERIAVVSDAAWIRRTINALRLLIACEVRAFSRDEAEEGLAWIAAPSEEVGSAVPNSPPQPFRAHPALPLRSRRPSFRPARPGDRQYRRSSAGGRQSR